MPIVLSKEEMARITRWTDRDREDPDLVRRREYMRYLDETSSNMTKNWSNSVENVNRRNEELRLARIQAAEQANSNFYKRYLKGQREQQQRLMHSARDTVFKNKDAPKLLLSAVLETCVQKERIEQLKFRDARRREQAEQRRKDDDEIIRKAKEWNELMVQKKKMRAEADMKYKKEIVDQAREIAEKNRIEYETELKMQILDNAKAQEQMDALREFEAKFNAEEKARIWADMDLAKREANARRNEQLARDKMDDRLIEAVLRSKVRVERKRRQTEKDIKEAKRKILENISSKLQSGDAARAAKEQAIMDKALKEKEAIAEKRREEQAKKEAQVRQERILQREQWLRDEEKRIEEKNTWMQWECMNRFKNVEIHKEYERKLREEKARKIKEFREDTLRLWREREEREAGEAAETRRFYGEVARQKLRAADNKLLSHAALLLQEARAHGRPDHALRKAIDRYCQLNRLYPMPDLPAPMKEHFRGYAPWDGTKPDPGYSAPPPPPPDRGPDALDDEHDDLRNGLEDPPKPSTSKTNDNKVKKEKPEEDYKRVGRANGLQRRDTEIDLTLPPITVIPCKNETCSCVLKQ